VQLIHTNSPAELPMLFTLDNGRAATLPILRADRQKLILTSPKGSARLVMTGTLPNGIQIVRTMVFHADTYLVDVSYQVKNISSSPLQISPAVVLNNKPFSATTKATSHYLFSGPSAYINGKLEEIKGKTMRKDGPQTLRGKVTWAAYEGTYFLCAVMPLSGGSHLVTMSGDEGQARIVVSDGSITLAPQGVRDFKYKMYLGPKKLSILDAADHDLAKAVNFGWFDVIAKPMLWLLNFFYKYIGNYGVAIILVTILIKVVFWPITQKGMKSMKNMQKLQPKVAKLKEKFKDDPTRMNKEMMALYKTYKVNPVGGCLPMVIQIPFFFALYRVLMSAIELRHAPFLLWINDLSAPDRLMIGFNIPWLHGIPVLTLLMGVSMYLQQKMTPTTADPTQAKIMQFLPVIFTFMFINFASGLVLYWFVNNLLAILQQHLINRQSRVA
ncbi:MAG: membrane protein insertase YidC, partial [Proteobacteria bacterium]|nr:membrane protein insertase YidC [Pseudomonadota bacterium]